jgi:hypothetical protein
MIPFKTKDFSFSIPSDFNDITMRDLLFIKENIDNDILIAERLTGLKIEQLSRMDLTPIIETLNFLNTPLSEIEPKQLITVNNTSYLLPEKIISKTWYQKNRAFEYYEKNEKALVIATYLEPIIRGKKKPKEKKVVELSKQLNALSVEQFFGAFNYIELQIKDIAKKLNDMPQPRVTPEQIEAGAESLNVLGEFLSIDNIARTYGKTHNEVLMWSYSTILNILYKNNLNTIFETNYSRIMTEKAKQT